MSYEEVKAILDKWRFAHPNNSFQCGFNACLGIINYELKQMIKEKEDAEGKSE